MPRKKNPLAAVLVKSKDGDRLRIVPVCGECRKVILNDEFNVVIWNASPLTLEPICEIGKQKVFAHSGNPQVLCWACDQKRGMVPWLAGELAFRGIR